MCERSSLVAPTVSSKREVFRYPNNQATPRLDRCSVISAVGIALDFFWRARYVTEKRETRETDCKARGLSIGTAKGRFKYLSST